MEKETGTTLEHKLEHERGNEEDSVIDITTILKNFFQIFLNRLWAVALAAIVGGALFGIRAYTSYTPYYEAKSILAVNAGYTYALDVQSYSTYYDSSAAKQVVSTFPDIISTEAMKELIAQSLGKETVYATVSAELAAENSNLFSLTVRSSDPQEAYDVLQAVMDNYPRVAAIVLGDTQIYVIEEATVPTNPANSRSWKSGAVKGAMLGVGIVMAFILLAALSIHTVNSSDDLKNAVSIKCLGTIPYCRVKKRTNGNAPIMITNSSASEAFSEAILTVRTRLLHYCKRSGAKVILITSTFPGEGKTTLAANLAISLAQNGSKVILVDADLRLQSMRKFFGLRQGGRGLVDALNAQNPYMPGFLTEVGIENFKLISGGSSSAPFSILRSKKIKNIFDRLRKMADYVVVDTPPTGILSDAESFVRYADGVIYMIKADYASKSQIIDSIQTLSENRAEMVGYVVGGTHQSGGNYGYGYGGHGYSYGYNYKKYGYGEGEGYGYGKHKSKSRSKGKEE